MPDLDGAVFGSRNDDRKFRVVDGKTNIRGMAFECCDQRFRGVVPYFDSSVVRCGKQIRLIGLRVVVDEVDALGFMRLESKVRRRATERPDLDGSVETS